MMGESGGYEGGSRPREGTDIDRFTRNLDWNLLKYFIQIGRSGGIGAAAASLNLSQPSVSGALRKLEESLGARLFIRTRKGVQLTAVGEQLMRDCEPIAPLIGMMPVKARDVVGAVGGSVLLKTISHVVSPALNAGIRAFRERHPAVELVVETAPWEHISKALCTGDLAVAVGFDDAPLPALRSALLTLEHVQIYCAQDHPMAGRIFDNPAHLADQPFVAFSEGEPDALRAFRQRHGLGGRVAGLANTVYDASWLISLGVGVGMLPEPAAQAFDHPLVGLLPRPLLPQLPVNLLWRSDLQDRASQLLVEAIAEHLR